MHPDRGIGRLKHILGLALVATDLLGAAAVASAQATAPQADGGRPQDAREQAGVEPDRASEQDAAPQTDPAKDGAGAGQADDVTGAQADSAAPADIVVVGQAPAVKRTIDGTKYDVRDNAAGQAGSVVDVLNTVPSVNVSPDGSVTVRGDSNVQVYINGRPSGSMTAETRAATLQSMSGGAIADVEVITSPSAKFDANGGKIINLTLKKGQGKGFRNTITANVGDHRRANLAVNNAYQGDAFSASLNASLRDDVRFTDVEDERQLLADDGSVAERFLTAAQYTPTHRQSANISGSLGYALTPNSDLGLDLSFYRGTPKNTVYEQRARYDAAGDVVERYERVRGGSYLSGNQNVSVYYAKRGSATSASLSLSAEHGSGSIRSDRLFTTSYDLPVAFPTEERVLNLTETRNDRLAADYDRPIGSRVRLSLGSEWKRDFHRYTNGRSDFRPVDDLGALDLTDLTMFEAVERTFSAYVSAQAQFGDWTVQAGERFQHLGVSTEAAPAAARVERSLSWLNHSVSVAHRWSDDQLILRFSRAKQRPDPKDLNPVVVYVDAFNSYVGNPLLSPQTVTGVEAQYDLTRGRIEAVGTFYYRQTDDSVVGFSAFDDDGVLLTTKRNAGRSQAIGAEATLSGRIGKDLKFSLTGNLFRAQLATVPPAGDETRSLTSYALQSSIDWEVSSRDQLHVDANAQGPTLVAQGVRTGTGALNLVWRHTLKPKLTLSLTAQSLISQPRVRTRIETFDAIQRSEVRSGARAVFVGLSYRM